MNEWLTLLMEEVRRRREEAEARRADQETRAGERRDEDLPGSGPWPEVGGRTKNP